jgi:uncharacterized protein (DUF2267 family)
VAERIAPGESDDLVARLPIELHPLLKEERNAGTASHVSLEKLLKQVAQCAGISVAEAERHARAVLTTLRGKRWVTTSSST